MRHRLIALLAALSMLVFVCGLAEEPDESAGEPTLVSAGLDLGTASVHWPQVSGMEDAETQALINARLAEAANASALSGRMALTMSADPPLVATWRGEIRGNILSVALYAEGPIETERFRSVWRSVNLDLSTGEAFTWADLFDDPDGAAEAIGDTLEWDIAPGLSAHLMNSQLTPLPEDFLIEETGLTLLYPVTSLSTLSDRAGCVTLGWQELPELNTAGDGIPARFGIIAALEADGEALLACLAEGTVPGLPAALGDSVEELVSRYRMPAEPDLYAGGRYVLLEDSRFRDAWLMTDNLSVNIRLFPGSTVNGIRTDRFGLHGLVTGCTSREETIALLGEPESSVALTAIEADDMRLPEGVSDYYTVGEHRLRLHYDAEDLLCSLILLP